MCIRDRGIRDCWMTFSQCENMKYAIVYSSVRGLLEIYRMRSGCKLYSSYIENGLRLFDLSTPAIFSEGTCSLYSIELESSYSKAETSKEYLKKLYMEEYISQNSDVKENSAVKEIVKLLKEEAKCDREQVRTTVGQISSPGVLYGLCETVAEIGEREDVVQWIVEEVVCRLGDQQPQNATENEAVKAFMEEAKETRKYIELYIDIMEVLKQTRPVSAKAELEQWLVFYDYILQHERTSKTDSINMSLKEFIAQMKKGRWDTNIIAMIMETLKNTDRILVDLVANKILAAGEALDLLIAWHNSVCDVSSCYYPECKLWSMCQEKENPMVSWLIKIDESLAKVQGGEESKNNVHWEKLKEYCLKSPNLLHVVIISNILSNMSSAGKDYKKIENSAKFHLLVLSNIAYHVDYQIFPKEPFVLGKQISIYEYIGKCLLLNNSKSIQAPDISKLPTFKKVNFSLELDRQYKTFDQYLQYARKDQKASYKDFIFLLCKLTGSPERVNDLLVFGQLYSYLQMKEFLSLIHICRCRRAI
eukprot:TRINITY_DN23026_c0_g1_i2.p1 TRINITY_DN23026_c0_g1~~TRINITY_DN23026_c0_g1_i2.p1  ORF type:complete len:532 (+),score=87.50 TRINITY_DN23026_c0_g1_i2:129-1724(+)